MTTDVGARETDIALVTTSPSQWSIALLNLLFKSLSYSTPSELTCLCPWCLKLPLHQPAQLQRKPRLSFCCRDFSLKIEILASRKAINMRCG